MYSNPEHKMFINLETSKEFGFKVIIYHLKENLAIEEYLTKKTVEPILFLS